MTPESRQQDREHLLGLLDDIDNDGHGVTDWEADFIDQMLKRMEAGEMPTQKQADTIRKIYSQRVK